MESHTMRSHLQPQKLQSDIAERANYESAFENCQPRGKQQLEEREKVFHMLGYYP